jgi:hypothetical protein
VGARTGDQGDEALDELVGRKHEGGRAIAPGALELELEAALGEAGQAIVGDGWTGEVARHALEIRDEACQCSCSVS